MRRLTFDLWRPAGLRASALKTDMLRDGRKAKTVQVRLMDGEVEIGRCTALLTAQGDESPADPFSKAAGGDAAPEAGTPPPAFAQKWSRYFQNVSVRLIEGALEKPGPAAAWMRLDVPMVEGETNTPLLQAVQAADFSSGVGQIVDMREWTFINPEISLYFFRPPEGEWILIRSRTRVGANGAGLTTATFSDRQGPFAEVMQAMTFERREATRLRRPERRSATSAASDAASAGMNISTRSSCSVTSCGVPSVSTAPIRPMPMSPLRSRTSHSGPGASALVELRRRHVGQFQTVRARSIAAPDRAARPSPHGAREPSAPRQHLASSRRTDAIRPAPETSACD